MDAQQIKELIASAIAGQGNQVDTGGKLADILNAIVDMAGQGGGGENTVLLLPNTYSTDTNAVASGTFEEIAEAFGITADQVEGLFNGNYLSVILKISAGTNTIKVPIPFIMAAFESGTNPVNASYHTVVNGLDFTLTCANDGVTADMTLRISVPE